MDHSLTASRTAPDLADWVPVDACTLPTSEQPLRVAAFDDLFTGALRAVQRRPSATRARLWLAGEMGRGAHVQCLADAESACCSFFTFTVPSFRGDDGETVTLDIEVPAAHAAVLTALVDPAERAPGAVA